jgi:flagellin
LRAGFEAALQAKDSTASVELTSDNYFQITSKAELTFSNYVAAGTPTSAAIADLAVDGTTNTPTDGGGIGGPDSLREGDLVINGVAIQAAKASDDTYSNNVAASSNRAASGIAIAAAINAASEQTGVTATVQATEVGGREGTTAGEAGAVGAVHLNGEVFAMTLTGDAELDRATAMERINSISGKTGVMAEDTGSALKLTAADGRNISLVIDTNEAANTATAANGGLAKTSGFSAANIGLDASQSGIVEVDLTGKLNGLTGTAVTALDTSATGYKDIANAYAETTTSKVTLSSAGQFTVEAGKNNSAELAELGFQVGTFGGTESGQYVKDIDISTVDGATKALEAIDNALSSINSERGNLGAIQNRLGSTISAMSITSENLSASRSRIQDADFAAETAELSRVQILQQAGTAMLSQANASTQNVLSLLR